MENQMQESAPFQPNQRLESPPRQSKRSRNASLLFPASFPVEIIVEILSYIPVESLLRFRCVSKSWKALLSDPFLIKKHLKRNQKESSFSNKRVLISVAQPGIEYSIKSCFLNAVYEDSVVKTTDIEYQVSPEDLIVGSCNGLICIANGQDRILLVNPTLRVFRRLPEMEFKKRRGRTTYGFGFDASMDDYKVVVCHLDENIIMIYSLRTNCWRRITQEFLFVIPCLNFGKDGPNSIVLGHGKYVDGSLNWLVYSRQEWVISCTVVSLDLAREMFKELMLPCYGGDRAVKHRTLGVFDGCLSVISDFQGKYAEVWVMKEYGNRGSWTKLVTVPYKNPFYESDLSSKWWYSTPLFVSESDEILLRFGRKLIIYNPKENMFREPKIPDDVIPYIHQVVVYEESLVSPTVEEQHR